MIDLIFPEKQDSCSCYSPTLQTLPNCVCVCVCVCVGVSVCVCVCVCERDSGECVGCVCGVWCAVCPGGISR